MADITSMKYILVSNRIFHVSDICAYLFKGVDSKMYILFYLQYVLVPHTCGVCHLCCIYQPHFLSLDVDYIQYWLILEDMKSKL